MRYGKRHHMAQSVDVDRFSDNYLRKVVCPGLKNAEGRIPTPTELRAACAAARALGYAVFPPCDNTNPDGTCAGHDEADTTGGTE